MVRKYQQFKMCSCQIGKHLSRLIQDYGLNHPTLSAYRICGKYNNIFTKCTNKNQFDTLMTAVADVRKGQIDKNFYIRLWQLNGELKNYKPTLCYFENNPIHHPQIMHIQAK